MGCNCRKKKPRTLMERRADLSASQGSGSFATSSAASTAGSDGGPSATTTDTSARTEDTTSGTVKTSE